MKKARKLPMRLVAFRAPIELLKQVWSLCTSPREFSEACRQGLELWLDRELDRE